MSTTVNYRALARAFGGGGGSGSANARKPPAHAALPPDAEHPAPLPNVDAAPGAPLQTHAPARSTPQPAAARIDPVAELLGRLDAAANDAERAALLSITPEVLRDDLAAALAYKAMTTPPHVVGLEALVAALSGAEGNVERASVLSAANLEQRTALAEYLRCRIVPVIDVQRHYLSLVE